jgi:hypothetical protein
MAAPHVAALLSVTDAKIHQLLTDPAGGTATYGSAIDIPDMTGVTLSGDTDIKERRGDGVVRDSRQILTGVTLAFTNTALPLDALAVIQGGTVVDSGSGTSEVATYTLSKGNTPKYLKFEAQCTDAGTGLGDFHLVAYKCKLTNFVEIGLTDDDFQTYSWELGVVARDSDDKYYDLVLNETVAAIS